MLLVQYLKKGSTGKIDDRFILPGLEHLLLFFLEEKIWETRING